MNVLTGNRHGSLEAKALMNAGGFRVKPKSCLQGVLISSPPAAIGAFSMVQAFSRTVRVSCGPEWAADTEYTVPPHTRRVSSELFQRYR